MENGSRLLRALVTLTLAACSTPIATNYTGAEVSLEAGTALLTDEGKVVRVLGPEALCVGTGQETMIKNPIHPQQNLTVIPVRCEVGSQKEKVSGFAPTIRVSRRGKN